MTSRNNIVSESRMEKQDDVMLSDITECFVGYLRQGTVADQKLIIVFITTVQRET